ncbi:unnamed protein product [Lota lota]
MSSLLSADKDQIRNRKSLFDSPATTLPHASSRSQRVGLTHLLHQVFAGNAKASINKQSLKLDSGGRPSARRRAEEDLGCQDFKKLYEGALAANGRLRSRLDTSREELALVQSQLGRQRRRATDRTSNMLETEKKEKKSLESKISDMEEELKAKTELTTENQRLKDENGALIRVISKLSK